MNCLIKCGTCDREVLKVGENLWPQRVPGEVLKEACSELAHEDSKFRILTLPSTGDALLKENAEYLERIGQDVNIGDWYLLPTERFQPHHVDVAI